MCRDLGGVLHGRLGCVLCQSRDLCLHPLDLAVQVLRLLRNQLALLSELGARTVLCQAAFADGLELSSALGSHDPAAPHVLLDHEVELACCAI